MERELLTGAARKRSGPGHQRHAFPLSVVTHMIVLAMILVRSTRVLAPESQPGVPAMTMFVALALSVPPSQSRAGAVPNARRAVAGESGLTAASRG